MTTTDDLVRRFSDPNGFKKYIGFLGGKQAKAAHAVFDGAEAKGAARSYVLDHRQHDNGNHYYVRAISINGDLDEQTLSELSRQASLLDLGKIRWEGAMAPTMPDAVSSTPDARDIHDMSRPEQGIIVYPVTEDNKKNLSSYALWAISEGQCYIYPIDDKKL